jgi:S-DNA-T family DNA segregation ATPase FtsK/SpoIIIE
MTNYKRKKSVPKGNTKNEVIGISIVTASLLIGLSLYFNSLGNAGNFFRHIFLGTFGVGAYILPLIIFLIGSVMIINRGKINIRRRFWAACVVIFLILFIIHVEYSYDNRILSFMDKLNSAYTFGISSKGGGIFSELIDLPFIYIFDRLGTYIIFICAAII